MKKKTTLNMTIFGAAGSVGSRIVAEAIARGHQVTAVVRDPSQFAKIPATAIQRSGDVSEPDDVARLISGQDVTISAVRPPAGQEWRLVDMTHSLLSASARTGVRVMMVGGAASLRIPNDPAHTVLSKPGYLPETVVPIAQACFEQYQACLTHEQADWTYLCPPNMLQPGKRTGKFRLGEDELLIDEQGNSQISMEDFAVAMIDEAEQAQRRKARFTVAY